MEGLNKLEERIKERIKGDLNELVDDEDIQSLIRTALQEAFFQERRVLDTNSWNHSYKNAPPLIVELVTESARTQIRDAAVIWMQEHNEEVEKALREFLERRPGEILMAAIGSLLSAQVYQMQTNFAEQLKAALNRPL